MDIIFAVTALLTWTAASRFLFRRWSRDYTWTWSSDNPMHPGFIVAAAAVAALLLPVILPVRLFAYAVMSHPPRSPGELKARTRALEKENARLRQEQEGPRRATYAGDGDWYSDVHYPEYSTRGSCHYEDD
jgi:hypothetical protein